MKPECLEGKKEEKFKDKKKKKKILVAWSDEDTSSSLEDETREIVNLYLMGKESTEVSECNSFLDSSYYSSESEDENSLTFKNLCKRLASDLEKSKELWKTIF